MIDNTKSKTKLEGESNYKIFLFDLVIYISIMFLIREIYIPKVGFITNGLFWSFTTLVIAMWRMKIRNVTWRELGLRKPDNFGLTLGVSVLILATTMISLIIFNVLILETNVWKFSCNSWFDFDEFKYILNRILF